jgi:hypothetical protein
MASLEKHFPWATLAHFFHKNSHWIFFLKNIFSHQVVKIHP